ncbi:MAG: alpha/beta hydrolase family protein [Candidatus Heimdallarchaeaceae archaeon]
MKDYLDSLLTIPTIFGVLVSPNGKKVAYSWKNVHPNVDVFSTTVEQSQEPIALTKTPEMTIATDWFPKSNSLLVKEDKSRNERARLFKVDLDAPGKMIGLTMEDPPFFLRGGTIDPSEKWLVYAANYDFTLKKELEPTWVYKHNWKTGEIIALAKPKKPTYLYPELALSGDFVLYNRKDLHPKGDQYWIVDFEGEEDREVLNFGEKAEIYAKILPNSKKILFKTDTKDGETQKHFSFGLYDVKTEEIEWILDDPKRNIESVRVPRHGNSLVVTEYEKARPKISFLNLDTREELFLPRIKGNLSPLNPLSAKNKWLGLFYSSVQPTDLVIFDINDFDISKFQSITNVWNRTDIKKSDLFQAEDYEWKAKDGLTIHGFLYKPKKPNGKTIVYVHGGPTSHSSDYLSPEKQYYCNRGFVVLDPNYRGSTGYGIEFKEKLLEKGWGGDEQLDIWAGIEALIKDGLATEGKIGITGTSYGGYSSWFAITKAPIELIKAAVPICGMTDLVVDYYTTRPDLRPYSEEMMGGNPEEVPEKYYERSPINFVQNIKGKLLIVQGAQDPNVTPENVKEVKKKLDEYNIEYEELIFEDEGHGILKTKNQKILFKRIADFFEEALQ